MRSGYGAVPTLEDKIVQDAVAEVLSAIYEVDFLGFSYGFRPGRNPHMALDALHTAIMSQRVTWCSMPTSAASSTRSNCAAWGQDAADRVRPAPGLNSAARRAAPDIPFTTTERKVLGVAAPSQQQTPINWAYLPPPNP
jgi:hypothetical protein